MIFHKKKRGVEEWWTNVADLMSGLMMIFMFIAVSYMAIIQSEATSYFDLQKDLYQNLEKEFKDDLEKWQAKIEPDATVRFEEPEVLFEPGSAVVRPRFQEILQDFFPRYLKIVSTDTFRSRVEEIRIEGHTSSEWKDERGTLVAYFNNMRLSQDRTRSVLEYVFQTTPEKEKVWLREHLTANGLSSSKIVRRSDGNEDLDRSRRVEFRIRIKAEETMRSMAGK